MNVVQRGGWGEVGDTRIVLQPHSRYSPVLSLRFMVLETNSEHSCIGASLSRPCIMLCHRPVRTVQRTPKRTATPCQQTLALHRLATFLLSVRRSVFTPRQSARRATDHITSVHWADALRAANRNYTSNAYIQQHPRHAKLPTRHTSNVFEELQKAPQTATNVKTALTSAVKAETEPQDQAQLRFKRLFEGRVHDVDSRHTPRSSKRALRKSFDRLRRWIWRGRERKREEEDGRSGWCFSLVDVITLGFFAGW
ncbi:hypothetical protein BU26DRAFT_86720 [Trematosphaeria pertusa]|uniref:Uncharacterized protein n=1 Tax=Trematosphaeria pertusa TaxID=390896 RepID=A0A6A6I398_9PLEO|nr:uncharacterized protein BU26DRAFT_86720 [Trematosphaeria pertusa]KAF2244791.1 hypothetical protein BU26DRAFT_86720 [Trematosphaeria pertusa]